ncbi:MAG: DUF1549 domain-containing protein [Planctomycetota bacterium]|nr:DUF1549 domain-containing protein [Planctomycetota bacterium]
MRTPHNRHAELLQLLDELCESRLEASGFARLEELIRGDREALTIYLQHIDLHGSLHWDAAQCGVATEDVTSQHADSKLNPSVGKRSRRMAWISIVSAACLAVVSLLVALSGDAADEVVAVDKQSQNKSVLEKSDVLPVDQGPANARITKTLDAAAPSAVAVTLKSKAKSAGPTEKAKPSPKPHVVAIVDSPIDENLPIVEYINAHIRAGWTSAEVSPSTTATDAEWLRRIHLQLVGRIPAIDVVERFLVDTSEGKRRLIVDQLLDDNDYISHSSTVWTNLLVGRSTETVRTYDRPALKKFLREAFAYNRPWKDVVYDLVAAEGETREDGATNFLVAHVNNQAVPATAIVSRVFLGTQIHCTQCHDHPFNDWKQSSFWELNSCFQQTEVVRSRTAQTAEIVKRNVGGPVFFENRQGVLRAAYPTFAGQRIDPSPQAHRRKRLAELMTQGKDMQVALATVNRFWAHFMGCGFTNPVDDMGPHNPPSHPQVLERLAGEFVKHNYDVKQLIRWITQTECYQLTSRFGDNNGSDNPEAGYIPAFSRVYVRPLSPEQVYNSLLVATGVDRQLWDQLAASRENWLQQFVTAHETDENDESTAFEGTITQALLLMNGDLTNRALAGNAGSLLDAVGGTRAKDSRKLELLCLAALSRKPTPQEEAVFGRFLRTPRARNQEEQIERLRDVFWVYLNSSEFVSVH